MPHRCNLQEEPRCLTSDKCCHTRSQTAPADAAPKKTWFGLSSGRAARKPQHVLRVLKRAAPRGKGPASDVKQHWASWLLGGTRLLDDGNVKHHSAVPRDPHHVFPGAEGRALEDRRPRGKDILARTGTKTKNACSLYLWITHIQNPVAVLLLTNTLPSHFIYIT